MIILDGVLLRTEKLFLFDLACVLRKDFSFIMSL